MQNKTRWLLTIHTTRRGRSSSGASDAVHTRVVDLATEEFMRLEAYLEFARDNYIGGLHSYSLTEVPWVLNYEGTKEWLIGELGVKNREPLPFDILL